MGSRNRFLTMLGFGPLIPNFFDHFGADQSVQTGSRRNQRCVDLFIGNLWCGFRGIPGGNCALQVACDCSLRIRRTKFLPVDAARPDRRSSAIVFRKPACSEHHDIRHAARHPSRWSLQAGTCPEPIWQRSRSGWSNCPVSDKLTLIARSCNSLTFSIASTS